jgi:hypothetical protein
MYTTKITLDNGAYGYLFLTGAHKVPIGKDLGVAHNDLMRMPDDEATSFRKVGAVLYLLEKGLHRLLWVPCVTHLLDFFHQIN